VRCNPIAGYLLNNLIQGSTIGAGDFNNFLKKATSQVRATSLEIPKSENNSNVISYIDAAARYNAAIGTSGAFPSYERTEVRV
jgi:hypothetical protein